MTDRDVKFHVKNYLNCIDMFSITNQIYDPTDDVLIETTIEAIRSLVDTGASLLKLIDAYKEE